MIHAPHCTGGPLTTSRGYSVTLTTCDTCKAVQTERNIHQTRTPKRKQV